MALIYIYLYTYLPGDTVHDTKSQLEELMARTMRGVGTSGSGALRNHRREGTLNKTTTSPVSGMAGTHGGGGIGGGGGGTLRDRRAQNLMGGTLNRGGTRRSGETRTGDFLFFFILLYFVVYVFLFWFVLLLVCMICEESCSLIYIYTYSLCRLSSLFICV